ncbi:AraC family transcriptional regulator [uncultured Croceitalea sp.]|uniref:helix-turn-helix domain-containing protein n=1 Tax=uncultured Croceitalea sp. TaxID=1798908 RepID=UPI0033060ABB
MNTGNLGHTSALYLWNGLCVFWGTSFHTDPHAHNTLQIVFDIEKEFLLKDKETDWTPYSAVLIDADHLHQLDSNNSIQLFLYLDVESKYAKLLSEKYLEKNPIKGLKKLKILNANDNFLKQLLVQNNCNEMFKGCISIIQELLDLPQQEPIDKRVEKAIDYIIKSPVKNFKVKEVALEVGLSESRLRHLFKEHVGQSIQNFVKWMRVIDSLNHVLKGKKLINAAYDYGFSDASHMTKSFVEIIGVPPSKIKAYEKETRIIPCNNINHFSLNTTIMGDYGNNEIIKKINI